MLLLLILIFVVFTLVLRSARSAAALGKAGEDLVKGRLESLACSGEGFYPFHGLVLKTPDGTTQIDHILVSPYGIFVIETKNMTGWIFGNERSRVWTQTLFRNKFIFQNPLRQNYKHVKALENFLGLNNRFFYSLVVFVGDSEFRTIVPENVVTLDELLPYVKSRTERLLDEAGVNDAVERLRNLPQNTPSSMETHVLNMERNRIKPVCPRCGKDMVLRIARKGRDTGNEFWGCSGFPNCKATKSVV